MTAASRYLNDLLQLSVRRRARVPERRQLRTAARIASTCSSVTAMVSEDGLWSRAVSRTGCSRSTSYRTASPRAGLRTVLACLAVL